MALSKRFLGLGFTFSATDKGLEKKLKGVQSALEGIDAALKSINSSGSAATSSLGKISSASRQSRPKAAPKVSFGEEISKPAKTGFAKRSTVFDAKYENNEAFFKDVLKNVFKKNEDMFKSFMANVEDVGISMDEHGKILQSDEDRLKKIAQLMQKISKTDESVLFRTNLKIFFTKDIPEYLKRVSSSVDHFFQSIGLDLRAIIPPQVKALGAVVNEALIKPLLGVGKSLLNMTGIPDLLKNVFGGGDQKHKAILEKELKDLKNGISSNKIDSVKSLLKRILGGITEDEKKNGGGLFTYLVAAGAFLGGILIGLAERFKKAYDAFKTMIKSYSWGRKVFEATSSVFGKLGGKVKAFIEGLAIVKKIKAAFESVVVSGYALASRVLKIGASIKAAIASTKTGLLNLVKSFAELKAVKAIKPVVTFLTTTFSEIGVAGDKLSKFFGSLKAGFGNIISFVMKIGPKLLTAFKAVLENPFVLGMLKLGKGIGSKLFAPLILLDIFRGFSQAFEEESNTFLALIKGLVYALDNFLLNIPSFVFGKAKDLFTSSDKPIREASRPEDIAPMVSAVPVQNKDNRLLNELNSESATQTELQTKQVSLQEQNNALMKQMLEAYKRNDNMSWRQQVPRSAFAGATTDMSEVGDTAP